MEIHKTQFPENFQKFTQFMNFPGGYQGGIPLSFYTNLFWEGLKGTQAFDIMSLMPGVSIGQSPLEKYQVDLRNAKDYLTKQCGS